MPLNFTRARPLLQEGKLKRLFVEELGWEPCRKTVDFPVGERSFHLTGIAEKKGMVVWQCEDQDGQLPGNSIRLKLDRQVTQITFEHILVFVSPDRSYQAWVMYLREPGGRVRPSKHQLFPGQTGDALLQRLQHLFVSIKEEEAGLSIADIADRARTAFNVEPVVKRFYEQFRKEHAAFFKFVTGITDVADWEWYTSVMLNRLMFVYFIQYKGFLDGDHQYLRNRLTRMQREHGKDKFYSFYRYFLLRLFHEGLGKQERSPDLEKLVGKIPYLNGGIFDIHELERPERYGNDIQIADKAFERIFDFFDQWRWHLDERPLREGNEINPDVLGYIYEKYINQKQMGAYYTKEDITEYISKNTVIPFLFDAARAKCRIAFENPNDPTVWDMLKNDPDRFIYPAVRHGVDKPLPKDIAKGVNPPTLYKPVGDGPVRTLELRKAWNKPAPAEYALPTEIWREVVARRQRCEGVRKKLRAGEVRDVNDLITLNLDIQRFAEDVIVGCEGPDLLRAFWHSVEGISILDPTCGSGAFLFAALNILEPLYEACLDRMEAFLQDEAARANVSKLKSTSHGYPLLPHGKFEDFSKVLERVADHPSRRYFIHKSIILKNLYGVDIMEEAVEICKLRLFLKLAAQVDPEANKPNFGIEPLPDIDFNIRAGNTLVGYATEEDVRRCMKEIGSGQMRLMDEEDLDNFERFSTHCADVEDAFQTFRNYQLAGDTSVPSEHKTHLRDRLNSLHQELNEYVLSDYKVNTRSTSVKKEWLKTNYPFHWFVEFYGRIASGGFDVIIGNPPYFDLKQGIKYELRGYATLKTKNLYPLVVERATALVSPLGRLGFIIPVSSISTSGYSELQDLVLRHPGHFSSFDDRPSRLFDGLEHIQLTIHLLQNSERHQKRHFVTECYRWSAVERPYLFPTLEYEAVETGYLPGCIPKLSTRLEHSVLKRVWNAGMPLGLQIAVGGKYKVFYSRKVHNFLQAVDFIPKVFDGRGKLRPPSELKALTFSKKDQATAVFCILNSTLFRWFINVFSDCRHVNKREIEGFKCNLHKLVSGYLEQVSTLGRELARSLMSTSEFRKMKFKHDHLRVQCIIPKHSKSVLDNIDRVLSQHYGFTEEELDFIINYDIKYRIGRDGGEENAD